MAARTKGKNRLSSVSIFSSKIKCGDCASWYGSKVWHSNSKYRRVIWQCNHKFEGKKCTTPVLTEDEIKDIFVRAANMVITEKDEICSTYEQMMAPLLSTAELEKEQAELETEISVTAELIEDCIKENAHVALDQADYQQRYDALAARFDKAKSRLTEISDMIVERLARKHQVEMYLQELRERDLITEFHDADWLSMVDYMTVYSKKDIRVKFKDGTEIKA